MICSGQIILPTLNFGREQCLEGQAKWGFLFVFDIIIWNSKQMVWKLILIACLAGLSISSFTVDLDVTNKHGNATIENTPCNMQTRIDFFFSSNSIFKTGGGSTGLEKSTMKFMDINGDTLTLTLTDVELTTQLLVNQYPTTDQAYFLFTFKTSGSKRTVLVILQLLGSGSSEAGSRIVDVDNFNNVYKDAGFEYEYDSTFSFLRNLDSAKLTNGQSLSAFNFMNLRDYGFFFTAVDEAKTTTVLINEFRFKIPQTISGASPTTATEFTQKAKSGDKLCYGAHETEGIFQTHLRESFPLWTAWFGIFFFWLYYLLADSHTNEVYDQHFKDNKMTCWAFYSIHYLAHEDCFTRLSRLSMLLFNWSFQGMILAAIYTTAGQQTTPRTHYEIIIWSAVIAFAVSIPLPFILGGIFLRKIYRNTLEKYKVMKKIKNTAITKKDEMGIYEDEVDKKEETLYTLYYWYYIIIFAGFTCFWVAAIHMMQQTHREFYYLHYLWIGSLFIAFVIENLIFDPLMAFVLGNTGFYRLRGYYFEFDMVQEYKEIEE